LNRGAEGPTDNQQQQPSNAWRKRYYGVARTQLLAATVVSVFAVFWQDGVVAASVLSGGLLVGLNSILLARSVESSSQIQKGDGRGVLYRSAVVRFLLLIAVLVAAYLVGLVLPAIAAGMFAAYVGGYIYIVINASRFIDESGD